MKKLIFVFFLGIFCCTPFEVYASNRDDPIDPTKTGPHLRTHPRTHSRITKVYDPSIPQTTDVLFDIQIDVLFQKIPQHLHRGALSVAYFHEPQWLVKYMTLGLGISKPAMNALACAMTPTFKEVQAFYLYLKEYPKPGMIFYPKLLGSVLKIAQKYDPHSAYLSIGFLGIEILPFNLWALENISFLTLDSNKIVDLFALTRFTQLTDLLLAHNQVKDLQPLSGLTGLLTLSLAGNRIRDIGPLAQLTRLGTLILSFNKIESLAPIKNLRMLNMLSVDANKIVDLQPVETLTNLKEFNFQSNRVTDVKPLENLVDLRSLVFSYNKVTDLTPLKSLKQLTFCDIMESQVEDVEPLKYLTSLQSLNLGYNKIVDVMPLTSFTHEITIYLNNNPAIDTMEKIASIQASFEPTVNLIYSDCEEVGVYGAPNPEVN